MTALANLVVVAHLAFLAFVFFGARGLERRPRLAWVHGVCLLYALAISVVGWVCPLTAVEKRLRAAAGEAPYAGEFLEHYLWSSFGLSGTEVWVAALLIGALLACNWGPYRRLFAHRRERSAQRERG